MKRRDKVKAYFIRAALKISSIEHGRYWDMIGGWDEIRKVLKKI